MDDNTNNTEALPMDAKAIATNPAAYGLMWTAAPLNRQSDGKGPKTLLRDNVPILGMPETLEAVTLVAKLFPAVVYAGANGTSLRVRSQGVSRPFIEANPRCTDDDIKEHVVRSVLLGVTTRTVGSRTKYIGVDGKEYATLAEAQASANVAAKPDPVREAQDFIANAVETLGVTYNVAREAAMKKWPAAFTQPQSDSE